MSYVISLNTPLMVDPAQLRVLWSGRDLVVIDHPMGRFLIKWRPKTWELRWTQPQLHPTFDLRLTSSPCGIFPYHPDDKKTSMVEKTQHAPAVIMRALERAIGLEAQSRWALVKDYVQVVAQVYTITGEQQKAHAWIGHNTVQPYKIGGPSHTLKHSLKTLLNGVFVREYNKILRPVDIITPPLRALTRHELLHAIETLRERFHQQGWPDLEI